MWTLAFDTTTNFCSVILTNGTNKQIVFSEEMTFGQSEVLIPQIKKMLKKSSLEFSDVNLVAVCTGPGSFTGVRSSLAVARTFSIAKPQLHVAGISAFDVYIRGLKESQRAEINLVVIETKRDDFYVACYDKDLNLIFEPEAAFAQDIIKKLGEKTLSLVGDGVERLMPYLKGKNVHCVVPLVHPDIETLARIAIEQLSKKKTAFPKPLYLKAPNICVK